MYIPSSKLGEEHFYSSVIFGRSQRGAFTFSLDLFTCVVYQFPFPTWWAYWCCEGGVTVMVDRKSVPKRLSATVSVLHKVWTEII